MSNLVFDTEQGRTTSGQIETGAGNIENEVSTLNSSVTGLVGTGWVAPGANQFLEEFQQAMQPLTTQIESIRQMKQRLDQEIAEWERIAGEA